MPRLTASLAVLFGLVSLQGCFALFPADGGGQADYTPPRRVAPADVAVPEGYRLEALATGLTFPTGVAFDGQGGVYVTEAGYSYGPVFTQPRLVRVDKGALTPVATGDRPPWTGVAYADGAFFVTEGGHPGRLVRIEPDGRQKVLVDGIPSMGDHHTNSPVAGPDGWIYFSQGTATNSGVVGVDNYQFGWLSRHPEFHDVPGGDIKLAGVNFESDNPLTEAEGDRAVTGAFLPFGTASTPGQVVRGATLASGTILRVRPQGGMVEQVAWGFRNPFGLAFSPKGWLYATENGYDVRGSRPIFGAPDYLWRVERGTWHGWPDYVGGEPVTEPRFTPPGGPAPKRLLAELPNVPPKPVASLGVHSSSNGLDFSRSAKFGHVGDAFVAQFGDMSPQAGKVLSAVGFKVVRVNVANGAIADFAANRGMTNGPASKLETGGFERPVAVRFDPAGTALYVVDFGVMTMGPKGPEPRPKTGVLWRITRVEK